MLASGNSIPCPVCKTAIPFDLKILLQGGSFACPNCAALVSMQEESIEMAKDAVVKFEELKKGSRGKGNK